MNYKLIYIKWVDSTSFNGWKNLPLEDSEMCEIETVGYVIENHRNRIVIANSVSNANHCDGILVIPKGAILEKRYL